MLHILIFIGGKKLLGDLGELKRERQILAKRLQPTRSKERHPQSPRPWCPVPRETRGRGRAWPGCPDPPIVLCSLGLTRELGCKQETGDLRRLITNRMDLIPEGANTPLAGSGREAVRVLHQIRHRRPGDAEEAGKATFS